jgi:hypothetical protein
MKAARRLSLLGFQKERGRAWPPTALRDFHAQAVTLYRSVLDRNPGDPVAALHLAELLVRSPHEGIPRPAEGLALLDGLRRQPRLQSSPVVQMNYGLALEAAGQPTPAAAALRRAQELASANGYEISGEEIGAALQSARGGGKRWE